MTFWNVDLSMLCMHDSYHNVECSKNYGTDEEKFY